MDELLSVLTPAERRDWKSLKTPWAVQVFLDGIAYSTDPVYRSPQQVLRDRRAHCVDGALLAAAALRTIGQRPLVSWIHAVNDDGHMIALYRRGKWWGGIAKSNVVGLRFREPVYASLRELMMSYFNDYWNISGQRSMRGYTRAWDLSRFDRLGWMTSDRHLPAIIDTKLDRVPIVPVLPNGIRLNRVDERTLRAGLLGADQSGLFKPK